MSEYNFYRATNLGALLDANTDWPKNRVAILSDRLTSKEAEFIALYGRRRVGKTFLVKTVVNRYPHTFLEVSGLKNGTLQEQLANFIEAMAKTFHKSLIHQHPKSWKEAFSLLTQEISRLPANRAVVVFLDELPWLATPKSKLLQQIDYFWNNVWSTIPTFKLIVCGSAAAWILEKLVHAKGGLYNRITRSILLKPFNLGETEEYLTKRKIKLNRSQLLELYMVMGGIPHYLRHVEPRKSTAQNIDQLCFVKDGVLYEEFDRLFTSLFDKASRHESIVRALAKKRYGISRADLLKAVRLSSGSVFNKMMNELEASGFIKKFIPYGKTTKEQYFKIIDEYTLFYLKWVEPIKHRSVAIKSNYWHTQYKSPAWESWSGYAYETICYKHVDQIIAKLDISHIGCIIGSWRFVPKKDEESKGGQIDLFFDRDNGVISICEIKFNDHSFVLNKQYAMQILERNQLFCTKLKIKKQIETCFITKEKMKENVWTKEMVDKNVTSEDLFNF